MVTPAAGKTHAQRDGTKGGTGTIGQPQRNQYEPGSGGAGEEQTVSPGEGVGSGGQHHTTAPPEFGQAMEKRRGSSAEVKTGKNLTLMAGGGG